MFTLLQKILAAAVGRTPVQCLHKQTRCSGYTERSKICVTKTVGLQELLFVGTQFIYYFRNVFFRSICTRRTIYYIISTHHVITTYDSHAIKHCNVYIIMIYRTFFWRARVTYIIL